MLGILKHTVKSPDRLHIEMVHNKFNIMIVLWTCTSFKDDAFLNTLYLFPRVKKSYATHTTGSSSAVKALFVVEVNFRFLSLSDLIDALRSLSSVKRASRSDMV